jgi:hypothetical protein
VDNAASTKPAAWPRRHDSQQRLVNYWGEM